VLFDPIGHLAETPEGTAALDAALAGQPLPMTLDEEG